MGFYIALFIGFLAVLFIPGLNIRHIPGYELFQYAMLAIGLYGSVVGIELKEFHIHRPLILRAVTFGVIAKSLMTGTVVWLIFGTTEAFLFGIVVAQIDPLAVAKLLEGKSSRFTEGGRTILRAWSSFDDPVTVLLATYVYLPLVVVGQQEFSIWSYVVQLTLNLLLAGVIYCLHRFFIKHHKLELALLLLAFLVAVPFQLMLGMAIIGLFLRPRFDQLATLVHLSFLIAAAILGTLVEITIPYILVGSLVGICAYGAQAVATFLVAPRLNVVDKAFLATAQYNGITAVILALVLSRWIPSIVSVTAVAVIVINVLYYGINHFLEQRLR